LDRIVLATQLAGNFPDDEILMTDVRAFIEKKCLARFFNVQVPRRKSALARKAPRVKSF
jgi:hypothetical protein